MTGRSRRRPRNRATADEQNRAAGREPYADDLTMPQEDDPAGDGHMWSGKAAPQEDDLEDDIEVGAPGHIPTHPARPMPF